MTETTIILASVKMHEEITGSFDSFNQGKSIPSSLFIDAVREGWKKITSTTAVEALQDKIDVEDSLQSLKEAKGISLQDFERELGV